MPPSVGIAGDSMPASPTELLGIAGSVQGPHKEIVESVWIADVRGGA